MEEIAGFQYGLNEIAKEKGNIVYIRITDIDENGILKKDGLAYLNYKDNYKNYKLKKGDILVARIGATFGKSYYFDEEFDAVFAGYLIRINLKTKDLNPKFLFYFFQTRYFWLQAQMLVKGGAQPQFNANTLKDLLIPLPSLSIQNRIVQIMDKAYNLKKQKEDEAQRLLDSIDDYVLSELGIKLPELKDQMTFVVYADEVKGKRIDPYYYQPKFEEVEKAIERGKYKIKRLRDFIEHLSMGISVPDCKNHPNEVPFILGKNLKIGYLNLEDLEYISKEASNKGKASILKEGDVLFSVRGAYIGKAAVVSKELEGGNIINNIVKITLKKEINPHYLVAFLSSNIGQKLIYREVWGGAQPGFTNEDIKNLKIPLSPLSIQNKIAEEVKKRMQKAEKLKKEAKEILERAKQEVENMILRGK